jgi:hypothetical protein
MLVDIARTTAVSVPGDDLSNAGGNGIEQKQQDSNLV